MNNTIQDVFQNKKIDKLNDAISNLYEKKIKGQIMVSEFEKEYKQINNEKTTLQKEIERIQKAKKIYNKAQTNNKEIEEVICKILKIEHFTNEMWKKIVKKIEFNKNKEITIELTFSKI